PIGICLVGAALRPSLATIVIVGHDILPLSCAPDHEVPRTTRGSRGPNVGCLAYETETTGTSDADESHKCQRCRGAQIAERRRGSRGLQRGPFSPTEESLGPRA